MSRLQIKIVHGYSETLLDLTMEQMEEDVAKVITVKVLELLTEAATNRKEPLNE